MAQISAAIVMSQQSHGHALRSNTDVCGNTAFDHYCLWPVSTPPQLIYRHTARSLPPCLGDDQQQLANGTASGAVAWLHCCLRRSPTWNRRISVQQTSRFCHDEEVFSDSHHCSVCSCHGALLLYCCLLVYTAAGSADTPVGPHKSKSCFLTRNQSIWHCLLPALLCAVLTCAWSSESSLLRDEQSARL